MATFKKKLLKHNKASRKAYDKTKIKKKAPISKGANKLIPSMSNAPERKFIDVTQTNYATDYNGAWTLLNGVAQGTTASTRIGDSIMMKSLQIRLRAFQPQAVSSNLRVMIIVDTQAGGRIPTTIELLNYYTTPTQYSVLSLRNVSTLKRFICLKDICISMNNGNTANVAHEVCKDIFLNLNMGGDYGQGGSATYASIQANSIWLFAVTDTAPSANNPTITFTSRIRFTDN